MAVSTYALGNNQTAVGFFRNNSLYDNSGRIVLACSDGSGKLYVGPNMNGSPDFVLVGNQVREGSPNGSTLFNINDKEIYDGCGSLTTYFCLYSSPENRIALALTAIANLGDLRFRPDNADVVASSRYSYYDPKNKPDNKLDYSKIQGNSPDLFKNRNVPPTLNGSFERVERSSNSLENIQRNRLPPKKKTPNHYIAGPLATGENEYIAGPLSNHKNSFVQPIKNVVEENETEIEYEEDSKVDSDTGKALYELLAGPRKDDGKLDYMSTEKISYIDNVLRLELSGANKKNLSEKYGSIVVIIILTLLLLAFASL